MMQKVEKLDIGRCLLVELLNGCPCDPNRVANPNGCPLHEMRGDSPDHQAEQVRRMDARVIAGVLEHHDWCMARRLLLGRKT